MTIDAKSYFRPCNCEGGTIDTDTTIYLAPSASSQHPAGIPDGSDTTGDGTILRPFFSIKKAIEYLEGFNIKVGVYVTIKGLSGKYNYNENHAVEIKHKDAKYIKIIFDMLKTGNYHETTIDFSAGTTITNNSDHDLVEFTVDDIGTGFYQIQAGDYIKIIPDNTTLNNVYSAVWQGYYKVESVDVPNKKVTIKFKRQQLSGSYNPNHPYRIPSDTGMASITVSVIKFSTHVNMNYSSASSDFFIKSNYGFGGIQINASDTLYDSSSTRGCGFSYIYDGILHDVILHLNGFDDCCHYTNLDLTFESSDNRLLSVATSCRRFLGCLQCSFTLEGISANCCSYPFEFVSSDVWVHGYKKLCTTNNYSTGFNLSKSKLVMSVFTNASGIFNTFYNNSGVSLVESSSFICNSVNSRYNNYGLSITNRSSAQFYFAYNPSTLKSSIKYNSSHGIFITDGSSVDISYTDITNNSYCGIRLSDGSSVIISAVSNASTVNSYCNSNGSYGIFISDSSTLRTYRLQADSNGADGIYADTSSSVTLKETECNNNSSHGVYISTNTELYCNNVNVNNNTSWGIRTVFCSKAYIINYTSTYRINGNGGNNMVADYNSSIDVRTHDAITNTTPTKNIAPAYSDASKGSYIIESII